MVRLVSEQTRCLCHLLWRWKLRAVSTYQALDAVGVALITPWVIGDQDAVMVATLLALILQSTDTPQACICTAAEAALLFLVPAFQSYEQNRQGAETCGANNNNINLFPADS